MNLGRYVTLRLLEIECGFPPCYDKEMEAIFKLLNEEFISAMRHKTEIEHISGGDLDLLRRKYVDLVVDITKSPPKIDVNVVYAVFMLSRDYIVYFQNQRNGMFAMAVSYWLGDFIDSSAVEITAPRNTLFYKRKCFMELVNHVVVTSFSFSCRVFRVNSFLELFYKILS